MDDLSTAFAAAFIETVNGREWTFSPLRFRDWGELEQWVRGRILSTAREQAALVDDLTERRVIYDAAFERISQMSLATAGGDLPLMNPTGMLECCYRSLCRKHPKVTRDDVENILDALPDAFTVWERIMRISNQAIGVEGPAPKAAESAERGPT